MDLPIHFQIVAILILMSIPKTLKVKTGHFDSDFECLQL